MKNKAAIAKDHDARAKARRHDATQAIKNDDRKEYDRLMLLVGYHTIQRDLWYKSLANFGENNAELDIMGDR